MPVNVKKPVLPKGVPLFAIKKFKINGHWFQPGDQFHWNRLSISESRVISLYDHRFIGTEDPTGTQAHKFFDTRSRESLKQNLESNRKGEDLEEKKPLRKRTTSSSKEKKKEEGIISYKGGWYHVFKDGEQLTGQKVRLDVAQEIAEQYGVE